MQTLGFNDVVERFIYAHQQSQLQLQAALAKAKRQAAETKSQRRWEEDARQVALNTRFPQSIEAYDQITNPIHKLRVSRLLAASTMEEKERIATASLDFNNPENWTESECMLLVSTFGSDVRSRLLRNMHRILLNTGYYSLDLQRRCKSTSRILKAPTHVDDPQRSSRAMISKE
jgi:hypothetical protein